MFQIEKPGFYFDVSAADYFSDPCPSPSLTQSICKIIIERSPLHAHTAHPRLNPNFEPDDDTKFDIGNICHRMLIGRGKDIVVLPHDDWRTKEARAAREAATAAGQLAVLDKHHDKAANIVEAAWKQLEARKLGRLFSDDGHGEAVMAWQEGNLWFRQMLDWLAPDRNMMVDFKSTDRSAAPHALARNMVDAGWDIQAAMCERGLCALDGEARRRFVFVVQEVEAPHALSVCEMSESILTMGRKKLQVAIDIWRRCIERDEWPGYSHEIIVPDYPPWAEAAWLTREEVEFYDLARRG